MTCTSIELIGKEDTEHRDIDISMRLTCELHGKSRQEIKEAIDNTVKKVTGNCDSVIATILQGIREMI